MNSVWNTFFSNIVFFCPSAKPTIIFTYIKNKSVAEVGEITTNKHKTQILKSVPASASGEFECEKWCEVCF